MEQVFMKLFEILDDVVENERTRQEIYEEIVPLMVEHDQELVDHLAEEDETFAAAANQLYPD